MKTKPNQTKPIMLSGVRQRSRKQKVHWAAAYAKNAATWTDRTAGIERATGERGIVRARSMSSRHVHGLAEEEQRRRRRLTAGGTAPAAATAAEALVAVDGEERQRE
uniref:Uncharacterized protein n=1 Tax=Arundo donax TaxID=35708 RepID=A0A0A9EJS8_ARUDO